MIQYAQHWKITLKSKRAQNVYDQVFDNTVTLYRSLNHIC